MAYPPGVQTCTLTFSNPTTFLGNSAVSTEVTVQSTAGVVWTATGQPIDDFPEIVAPAAGMPGQLTVPRVDQAGFTDYAGNALTFWAYIITRTSRFGGTIKTVTKNWQPVAGQAIVDFDTLPGGPISLPVTVPPLPVTSVAGLTGIVQAEALADALTPHLPEGGGGGGGVTSVAGLTGIVPAQGLADVLAPLLPEAPEPGVTSVAGLTGIVPAQGLADALAPLLPEAPAATAAVQVITGAEARPDAALVFWVGHHEQPANMGAGDLWFSAPPPPDTTAPTAPTGLASSDITATGFTLTWTASTDNSGVTGYDIYLGGVLKASTTTAVTANITGLTASTGYSVTVKARDAAANVSAASAALSVTTGASAGSPRHSIWGSTAYPWTVSKFTEAEPITVANAFYSYGTSPDMGAWRVRGAKIWIPAGITLTQPADVKLWFGDVPLSAAPLVTATITEWVSGQWNEVIFPTVVETNSSDVVFIGYRFGNGDYLAATGLPSSFTTALDGSHIVLAEDMFRSRYKYDSGASTHANGQPGYGIDIIFDEGPGA